MAYGQFERAFILFIYTLTFYQHIINTTAKVEQEKLKKIVEVRFKDGGDETRGVLPNVQEVEQGTEVEKIRKCECNL